MVCRKCGDYSGANPGFLVIFRRRKIQGVCCFSGDIGDRHPWIHLWLSFDWKLSGTCTDLPNCVERNVYQACTRKCQSDANMR